MVRRWREALDPACARGIPAHVTVLFPLVPPINIDDKIITSLDEYFSGIEPFDFELEAVAWFEDKVVYLKPRPDTPFRNLTRDVAARYPQHLPYEGKFREPTPHLTVGEGAPAASLKEAANDVSRSDTSYWRLSDPPWQVSETGRTDSP